MSYNNDMVLAPLPKAICISQSNKTFEMEDFCDEVDADFVYGMDTQNMTKKEKKEYNSRKKTFLSRFLQWSSDEYTKQEEDNKKRIKDAYENIY